MPTIFRKATMVPDTLARVSLKKSSARCQDNVRKKFCGPTAFSNIPIKEALVELLVYWTCRALRRQGVPLIISCIKDDFQITDNDTGVV